LAHGLDGRWNFLVGGSQELLGLLLGFRRTEQRAPMIVDAMQQDRQQQTVLMSAGFRSASLDLIQAPAISISIRPRFRTAGRAVAIVSGSNELPDSSGAEVSAPTLTPQSLVVAFGTSRAHGL
jgi:hypothetical protein